MTYIITEPYIGTKDQSCVEVCPVDCTYDGVDQFLINPHGCIDCGACEPECPVGGLRLHCQTLRRNVKAPRDCEVFRADCMSRYLRSGRLGSACAHRTDSTKPFRFYH